VSDETKFCCTTEDECCKSKAILYGFVILGTLLIGAILVSLMIHYTKPALLTEDRAAFRAKNLAEIRAANAEALTTYGYVDPTKGIVRLPIEQAMQLAATEWKNPAAARSNLIARVEKATFVAPPPPAKPSAFE
jgi:hypothetical protein